jgi:hypothetical protein
MSKQTFFFNHHLNLETFDNYALNSEYAPKLYIREIFSDKEHIKYVDTYLKFTNIYLENTIEKAESKAFNPFIFKNKVNEGYDSVSKNMYSIIRHIKIKKLYKVPMTIGRVGDKYKKKAFGSLSHPLISLYRGRTKKQGVPVFIYKPVKSGYLVVPYISGMGDVLKNPIGSVSGFLPHSQYKLVIKYYKEKQLLLEKQFKKLQEKISKNKIISQNKKLNLTRKSILLKLKRAKKNISSKKEYKKFCNELKDSLNIWTKVQFSKDYIKFVLSKKLISDLLVHHTSASIESLAKTNPELYNKATKYLSILSRSFFKGFDSEFNSVISRTNFETKLYFPRNLMLHIAPLKPIDMISAKATFFTRDKDRKLKYRNQLTRFATSSPRYVFTEKKPVKQKPESITEINKQENKKRLKYKTNKKIFFDKSKED